jgi:hypothetical protein
MNKAQQLLKTCEVTGNSGHSFKSDSKNVSGHKLDQNDLYAAQSHQPTGHAYGAFTVGDKDHWAAGWCDPEHRDDPEWQHTKEGFHDKKSALDYAKEQMKKLQ